MPLNPLLHCLTLDIVERKGYFVSMGKSQVLYSKSLPSIKEFPSETILFYDKKTVKHPFIRTWVSRFKYKIALNAGEPLKTLESYSQALNQVQKITQSYGIGGSQLTFVALGGGSVGDFVGFLASTFQRGRQFISIPSTWLAAIDSAHGGKNGLNLNGAKNQIGTFYPAHKIYISERVLNSLPKQALNDSFAEALKICILNQPQLFFKIFKNHRSLFQNLPQLIRGKYAIVEKDPFEKLGLRKLLNLGHTMGHVFESIHGLSHGQSVFFGMLFSLRYSYHLKLLTWNEFHLITEKLFSIDAPLSYQQALKMPMQNVRNKLMQDKKIISNQSVDFILIRSLGHAIIKSVKVDDIITELLRQQREL